MKRNKKIHDRVVVSLLVDEGASVNHQAFKFNEYLGDTVNLVRIFCQKKVDEIQIADKSAFQNGINFELLQHISSVATVPLSYCGSVKTSEDAAKITQLGFEKIFLNNTFTPELSLSINNMLGKSSIGRIIDYKPGMFSSFKRYNYITNKYESLNVNQVVEDIQKGGVGELVLRCVNHDGCYKGFDFSLFSKIRNEIDIPTLLSGGASSLDDIKTLYQNGANGCVVSSLFTFYGAEKGILPNYPTFKNLETLYAESRNM